MKIEGKWPCWCIIKDGLAIIRNDGKLLYSGRVEDMPPEIKEFALTFDVSFEEAAPILFGEAKVT
jgi:hypothetical protein